MPGNFSEVPTLLRRSTRCSLVVAACSPPDRHGYFSLGTNADYVASMIGIVPFFLEATPHMPRTHGANLVHHSQIAGWCESDRPLLEVPAAELGRRIRARAEAMLAAGAVQEARTALAGPVSRSAAKALGLRELAELPPGEALERLVVRTRRYAAYQRKWMRRVPGLVSVDATRPPDEVADAILEVARAR